MKKAAKDFLFPRTRGTIRKELARVETARLGPRCTTVMLSQLKLNGAILSARAYLPEASEQAASDATEWQRLRNPALTDEQLVAYRTGFEHGWAQAMNHVRLHGKAAP